MVPYYVLVAAKIANYLLLRRRKSFSSKKKQSLGAEVPLLVRFVSGRFIHLAPMSLTYYVVNAVSM